MACRVRKCVRGCCWSNADGAGRLCIGASEYVRLAYNLSAAIGTRHVYIATEDPDEAAHMAALFEGRGLIPMMQAWRRDAFTKATRAASACAAVQRPARRHAPFAHVEVDGFMRIENAMDSSALDAEGAVLSAVADIQMLAEADAIVGGVSAFTTLAHRIGTARLDSPSASVAVDATERGIAWRPPPCRAMPNGL